MNEIQLLRAQLALERRHTVEVVNACARALARLLAGAAPRDSALGVFRQACVDYLEHALRSFERRDARLGELYRRLPPDHAERHAAEAALTTRGGGREALERLTTLNDAADTAAPDGWRELAGYLSDAWDARRGAVEALLAQNQRVTDWRAFSGLDADSILEERRLYSRLRATLPAGAELAAPPP